MFKHLKNDLPSSLVVFFVALPLCLGIALASGAPLFSGLIAGIVGGIVVGSLSGSSLGVSGPAAGLAVIVLNAITDLGSWEVFLVAVVLGGVLQIALGAAKAGIIGYYFPSSVIKGMLAGIGIIIFLKQLPHAVGYDSDYEGDLNFLQLDGETTFTALGSMMDNVSPGAIVVSLISLGILLLWDLVLTKKSDVFKIVPGPLIAVVVGILYNFTIASDHAFGIAAEHLVSVPVPESATDFLGQLSFPDFGAITRYDVWITAITLCIVASLETLLSVEATDKLDPQKRTTPTNRELFAQGTGNIVSGLIGGLPITQVIIRSSANVQSGGKTKMSAIIHGFLLLISVIAIPALLNKIPLAVLAAILLVVGYKLAKPVLFKNMYRLGREQFIPFIVTVLGVVFTDLLLGIGLGLGVGIMMILIKNYQNSHFLHIVEKEDGVHKVRMTLSEEVSFLNKGAILRELNNLQPNTHLELDVTKCIRLNYDILEILDDFRYRSKQKGIHITVISEKGTFENPESFMKLFLTTKVA
ncbi:SulP family inorganic anion transporter [Robertkochia flava]|uniref:SulP family inorganic anion transporter n=1 Tax=Robertkochia flava TaxID=3447986 RepID=UPI001CCBAA14|nr:SulP family inorganic anion transporter [Robertkochia marina]